MPRAFLVKKRDKLPHETSDTLENTEVKQEYLDAEEGETIKQQVFEYQSSGSESLEEMTERRMSPPGRTRRLYTDQGRDFTGRDHNPFSIFTTPGFLVSGHHRHLDPGRFPGPGRPRTDHRMSTDPCLPFIPSRCSCTTPSSPPGITRTPLMPPTPPPPPPSIRTSVTTSPSPSPSPTRHHDRHHDKGKK